MSHRLGGNVLHPDRSGFVAGQSYSIEPLKRYIANTVRFFVAKAIDNYFAAKDAGKLDAYLEFLRYPGACIEDQCLPLANSLNLPRGGAVLVKAVVGLADFCLSSQGVIDIVVL